MKMEPKILDYKDLIVWQKSMNLAEQIYSLSTNFPKTEIYGMMSQIRRAAISIPSNIAEGNGRYSDKEFLRFLSIANGSLKEIETQLHLSIRLKFVSENDVQAIFKMCDDVARLLNGLRKKISERLKSQ